MMKIVNGLECVSTKDRFVNTKAVKAAVIYVMKLNECVPSIPVLVSDVRL